MIAGVVAQDGPFKGWTTWPHDSFESHAGPFYARRDEAGVVTCRFLAEKRHINGGGSVHGGCLLTFADFAVFAIAEDTIAGRAVTINLSGDFLGPGQLGDIIEATGEVTRAGGRIIYVRGLITANGRPCLSYSSVITRIKPKA